jgi:hypothetical protein
MKSHLPSGVIVYATAAAMLLRNIKPKLHNLCSRFVLGDLMPKSFVLSAKFGRAPRVDFPGRRRILPAAPMRYPRK